MSSLRASDPPPCGRSPTGLGAADLIQVNRRPPPISDHAFEIAADGREVMRSGLALLEAEPELGALQRLVENGRFRIEANDVAAGKVLDTHHPIRQKHVGVQFS